MKLEGKVALVTGAASGFGAAIARRFCQEGARVLAVDIDDEKGPAVVNDIAHEGGEARFLRADVSVDADVAAAIGAVVEQFGRLDIVLNNAGIASPRVPIDELSEELFDRLFEVNVKSVYLCVRHALPALRSAGGGVIINTAATSALKPRPLFAGYAASKAAVITLTKALSWELAVDRIRVNVLSPVAADTPLFRSFLGDNPELAEQMAAAIPWGRLCTPLDVAAAAVFLASDEAEFLTGVNLPVDGGWTAG